VIIRRRTYNQLVARADAYAETARTSTRDEQAAYRSVARTALRSGRHAAELTRRLHRALGAVARERAESARLRGQLATLQAAYDNATGLDHPALDAGADWQSRRADKRKEYAA
jgi:hypothetical protein